MLANHGVFAVGPVHGAQDSGAHKNVRHVASPWCHCRWFWHLADQGAKTNATSPLEAAVWVLTATCGLWHDGVGNAFLPALGESPGQIVEGCAQVQGRASHVHRNMAPRIRCLSRDAQPQPPPQAFDPKSDRTHSAFSLHVKPWRGGLVVMAARQWCDRHQRSRWRHGRASVKMALPAALHQNRVGGPELFETHGDGRRTGAEEDEVHEVNDAPHHSRSSIRTLL